MLPYSPPHQLLLTDFGGALVATSGNLSGEPVLTEPQAVESRLAQVADGFLHHNRPIVRPADDPLVRTVAGVVRPLRLGRGNAPLELNLPMPTPAPILAVGASMKTTVALHG
jgi:hydrogenase maturation protein HypF